MLLLMLDMVRGHVMNVKDEKRDFSEVILVHLDTPAAADSKAASKGTTVSERYERPASTSLSKFFGPIVPFSSKL